MVAAKRDEKDKKTPVRKGHRDDTLVLGKNVMPVKRILSPVRWDSLNQSRDILPL